MVFIKINDTFFHKASEEVRDRETINGALMQIFVHLDLWIFQDRDKNGYKEKVMNNSTKKYLLRIFLFFQLNLNWKWCLIKGIAEEWI